MTIDTHKFHTIHIQDVILERLIDILFPTISGWTVYNKDRTIRLGVIYQHNTVYLKKRMGRLEFRQKYWYFERFYPQTVGTALTRKDVIEKLKSVDGTAL